MSESATTDAPAGTEEPEKPKRVSQMPPVKIRIQQERLYKEVRQMNTPLMRKQKD